MLNVASVAKSPPDVLRTSINKKSKAVPGPSFEVTFNQKFKFGDVADGIVICWNVVAVELFAAPSIKYPVPLWGKLPVERDADPDNVHGVLLPSKPPLTINSAPPAAFTVNVTGTLTGVFVAPAALTVIAPLNVPTASPAMFTDTEAAEGAVPEPGLTLSHG